TASEWVVTLDEDGQQDPADIARLLDQALVTNAQLVYAKPADRPPHGWLRNLLSSVVKRISIQLLGNTTLGRFNSFRLIQCDIARCLAGDCGPSVCLDAALSWIVSNTARCSVHLRDEGRRRSGYTFRKLLSHFWRLVLPSGTRPLRVISLIGVVAI